MHLASILILLPLTAMNIPRALSSPLSLDNLPSLSDMQSLYHRSPSTPGGQQPRALVYAGPATTPDLAQSVGHLLRTSPANFSVSYVGGNMSDPAWEDGEDEEEIVMIKHLNETVLEEVDLFAVGGGDGA
jgi:hypothetical protein